MARRANAHDLYFKNCLSEPGVAADFVAHYLPPEVAAEVDLSTVTLSPFWSTTATRAGPPPPTSAASIMDPKP